MSNLPKAPSSVYRDLLSFSLCAMSPFSSQSGSSVAQTVRSCLTKCSKSLPCSFPDKDKNVVDDDHVDAKLKE